MEVFVESLENGLTMDVSLHKVLVDLPGAGVGIGERLTRAKLVQQKNLPELE